MSLYPQSCTSHVLYWNLLQILLCLLECHVGHKDDSDLPEGYCMRNRMVEENPAIMQGRTVRAAGSSSSKINGVVIHPLVVNDVEGDVTVWVWCIVYIPVHRMLLPCSM